jgi:hypothetical protein
MAEAALWIVGDWWHVDFADAVTWLNAAARCECFADAEAALTGIRENELERDLAAILLVESRPGMTCERNVERLHAAAPLARLVALIGLWCEGEMRSGRPWPGVVRIPWRAWQSRLPAALGLVSHCNRTGAPPRTATWAEHIESSMTKVRPRACGSGPAAIRTSSRATFEAMADALKHLGMTAVWADNGGSWFDANELLICHGWEHMPADETLLQRSILLLDFPRTDDLIRARSRGVAAVVAQPLLLADLEAAIDSATDNTLTVAAARK